jgi:hypothetical protein
MDVKRGCVSVPYAKLSEYVRINEQEIRLLPSLLWVVLHEHAELRYSGFIHLYQQITSRTDWPDRDPADREHLRQLSQVQRLLELAESSVDTSQDVSTDVSMLLAALGDNPVKRCHSVAIHADFRLAMYAVVLLHRMIHDEGSRHAIELVVNSPDATSSAKFMAATYLIGDRNVSASDYPVSIIH